MLAIRRFFSITYFPAGGLLKIPKPVASLIEAHMEIVNASGKDAWGVETTEWRGGAAGV
jgi:hypothetical protein